VEPDDPTVIPEGLPGSPRPASDDDPPRRIGPYRLLEKIGEGGFGEVWLAEQAAPIRRRVALKIIKRGMDSRQVLARFEAERQALAMMDHPVLAKVFDAGTTPHGRPYFVMEHIHGVPITEHCDTNRLTTRQRLELFVQVCEGVQHAHQKAIIHRDLKPSNVLVSIQDERAHPKIIDFGVAKAAAHQLTEKTMYTEQGMLIGTPEYMSPEQAEMTGQDVDTRTDVYALGVMLYELLVGVLPFDSRELRQAGFDEIRRKIREDEPPRPSTRLSRMGGSSTGSAEQRQTALPILQRELRGDLDWITMKALEKDRTRRYGSPQELAADVVRHLNDKPVLAGPPSAAYRTRKFVRRHRVGVAAGSLVALALVVGMAGTAFGLVRARRAEAEARREAETSERVSEFLADILGEVDAERMGRQLVETLRQRVADAARARGASAEEITAALASLEASLQEVNATDVALRMVHQEVLERAGVMLEGEFGEEPRIEARLRQTIAETYRSFGLFEQAERHARRAMEIRRRVLGEDHLDTFGSMCDLAKVYMQQGRYDEAEALHNETLDAVRRVFGDDHPQTLTSMTSLASVYFLQGRYDDAEALYREALDAQRRVLGDDDAATIGSMTNLASAYWSRGAFDEAEELYRETLEASRRVLGDDDPNTLALTANLAYIYWEQGRLDEAEALHHKALEERRRVFGDDHPQTIASMMFLAGVYRDQGRYDEAEALHHKTLDAARDVLGDDHPKTLGFTTSLASVYSFQGRYEESEALLVEVVELQRRAVGENHPATLTTLNDLGDVYRRQGRYEQAAVLLGQALEARRSVLDDDHPDIGASLHALGCLAAARGERQQALDLLRQALDQGWAPRSLIEDADLRFLRGDPAFEAMVDEVTGRLGIEAETD